LDNRLCEHVARLRIGLEGAATRFEVGRGSLRICMFMVDEISLKIGFLKLRWVTSFQQEYSLSQVVYVARPHPVKIDFPAMLLTKCVPYLTIRLDQTNRGMCSRPSVRVAARRFVFYRRRNLVQFFEQSLRNMLCNLPGRVQCAAKSRR